MVPFRNFRLLKRVSAPLALALALVLVLGLVSCSTSMLTREQPSDKAPAANTDSDSQPAPSTESDSGAQLDIAEPTPEAALQDSSAETGPVLPTPVDAEPTAVATPSGETQETQVQRLDDRVVSEDDIENALERAYLESEECPKSVSAGTQECFRAYLPENIFDPESRLIEIAGIRVNAGASKYRSVYLQGGPGIGTTYMVDHFARTGRDTFILDARSTGRSEPKLGCVALEEFWVESRANPEYNDRAEGEETAHKKSEQMLRECVEGFISDGTDLNYYNTRSLAADIELIRRLHEVDSWILHGSSYGTKLALEILRNYPETVEAVLLESPLDLGVDFFAGLTDSAIAAIDLVERTCSQDSACFKKHGSFREELFDLITELNEEPVEIEVTRPVSAERFLYQVDGNEILDVTFALLYYSNAIESLPRQVSKARWGGLEEMMQFYVNGRDPQVFDFSYGLYWSTWCREGIPHHNPAVIETDLALIEATYSTQVAESFEANFASDSLGTYCEILDVDSASLPESIETADDTPIWIFAGSFDPVTPAKGAEALSQKLAGSTYLNFGEQAHGIRGSCAGKIRDAILTDPHSEIETDCVDPTKAPEFD